MKCVWHTRKGRPRLLLFFLGWGMDERPFRPLAAQEVDVLLLYDYRNLALPALPESYEEIEVLGWSFGVYAALRHLSQGNVLSVNRAIFLNGTGAPYDRHLGIPPRLFDATYKAFQRAPRATLLRFYRNMFSEEEDWLLFQEHLPQRLPEELLEELASARHWPPLLEGVKGQALCHTDDAIIPYENQKRYWQKVHVEYHSLPGGHFPFYRWASLDDLVKSFG